MDLLSFAQWPKYGLPSVTSIVQLAQHRIVAESRRAKRGKDKYILTYFLLWELVMGQGPGNCHSWMVERVSRLESLKWSPGWLLDNRGMGKWTLWESRWGCTKSLYSEGLSFHSPKLSPEAYLASAL